MHTLAEPIPASVTASTKHQFLTGMTHTYNTLTPTGHSESLINLNSRFGEFGRKMEHQEGNHVEKGRKCKHYAKRP